MVAFWWFFVLCGGGFCVDSGGFYVGGGEFFDIKFVWKLRKWLRKCEKFVGKYHFQNITKH